MTCAFAVRGALKKFSGVESVDVSLNKGLATVKLKPGNTVTPEEFWETVRKNGFTPKETTVVVRGEVQAGKLKVSGHQSVPGPCCRPKEPESARRRQSARQAKLMTCKGLSPRKPIPKRRAPFRSEA